MTYCHLWLHAQSRWTEPRVIIISRLSSILLLNKRDVGIVLHGMQHRSIPQMMGLKCIRLEAYKIIVWKCVDALLLHDDYAD